MRIIFLLTDSQINKHLITVCFSPIQWKESRVLSRDNCHEILFYGEILSLYVYMRPGNKDAECRQNRFVKAF